MDKMTSILGKLIDLTQEGKLKWSETADQDGFIATVGNLGVIVRYLGRPFGNERHKFEILNRDGRIAETLETDDEVVFITDEIIASDDQAHAMARLYSLARRSALDADATLDDLAQQLDAIR